MLIVYPLFEKKVIKTEETKNFNVDDYKKPDNKKIQKDNSGKPIYRSKKLPDGTVLRFAIKKEKGPRGGQTEITSKWSPKEK